MSEVTLFSSGQAGVAPIESLQDRRASLERRLQEGYVRIDEALDAGRDVTSWERFWIGLLHEYEVVCSRLQEAA